MGSANEVPFCFAGSIAFDIGWVVLIPGLTGFAITSHRPHNFVRVLSRTLIMQSARACAGFDTHRRVS